MTNANKTQNTPSRGSQSGNTGTEPRTTDEPKRSPGPGHTFGDPQKSDFGDPPQRDVDVRVQDSSASDKNAANKGNRVQETDEDRRGKQANQPPGAYRGDANQGDANKARGDANKVGANQAHGSNQLHGSKHQPAPGATTQRKDAPESRGEAGDRYNKDQSNRPTDQNDAGDVSRGQGQGGDRGAPVRNPSPKSQQPDRR